MEHSILSEAARLEKGERLEMKVGHSKQDNITTVQCRFASFSGLRVGHGLYSGFTSSWVDILPDRVVCWVHGAQPDVCATLFHGLKLEKQLTATLTALPNKQAYLLLSTRTGTWQSEPFPFRGCSPICFAEALNGPINNLHMTYLDLDKQKETWLFGDSYMDFYPKYLIEAGYGNFALDGYGGLGAAMALDSLKLALTHWPAPKRLIWALGMNNPDEENAINQSYAEVAEELQSLCAANGTELILCTVPNVPERNHRFKNAYTLDSGYRVCDLAAAVEEAGNNQWFPGTLAADLVHPTDLGSRLIAMQFISEVPEIRDTNRR